MGLNLPLRQSANESVFETGIALVLLTQLARCRAQLLKLLRQAGAEIAHRKVKADLHPLPPALRLELIRVE
jgi:hypothetical protein